MRLRAFSGYSKEANGVRGFVRAYLEITLSLHVRSGNLLMNDGQIASEG